MCDHPGGTDLATVRSLALALPEATEQPHFELTSFRVRGKIFATVPPDDEHLHVFVAEAVVTAWAAQDAAAFEPLYWGKKLSGLRVRLGRASAEQVSELLEESWRRKAPAKLVRERDGD